MSTSGTGSKPVNEPPLRCSVCQRVCPDDPASRVFRPFCSRRCQQVDLMRWMDGRYAIVEEIDPELIEDVE